MEFTKLKISLIGCGWLGLPLYKALAANGHNIITTTTTHKKKAELSAQFNIEQFDILSQNSDKNLTGADIIIYTIPPLGLGEVENFFSPLNSDQKIIFISSTSVYGKSQGNCNEETILTPESKNGKIIKNSEDYLRIHFKNITILRPGGLYGEKRHPIFFLQGKRGLKNGMEYTHLAHLKDCIYAILAIIEKQTWGEVFNIVSDLRIKKEIYYLEMARKLKLLEPEYEQVELSHPTKISNKKSKKILSLIYQNPLDYFF